VGLPSEPRQGLCISYVVMECKGDPLSLWTSHLMRHVVDDEHGARELHHAVVAVVRLQVHREQRRVPVIGHEDEVAVAVAHPPQGTCHGAWAEEGSSQQGVRTVQIGVSVEGARD